MPDEDFLHCWIYNEMQWKYISRSMVAQNDAPIGITKFGKNATKHNGGHGAHVH